MTAHQALSNNSQKIEVQKYEAQTYEVQTYLDEQDFALEKGPIENEVDSKIRDLFSRVAIGKPKPVAKSRSIFSCFGESHQDACEKYPQFTGAAKDIVSLWVKKNLPVDFLEQAQKLLTIKEHKTQFIETGLTLLVDAFIDFLTLLEIDSNQDHIESIAGIFRVSAGKSDIDLAMKSLILDKKIPDMFPRHDRSLLMGSLLKQCCRCLQVNDISPVLQEKMARILFLIIKIMGKEAFKDAGKMDIRSLRIAAPAIFDLISPNQVFAHISEDDQKGEFGQFIAKMQSKSQSVIASSHFTLDDARKRLDALLQKEKEVTSVADMRPPLAKKT